MDHYETLGVSKQASAAQIKAAYRKLALKYHPDRNPGDVEAESHFKQVQSAYDTLSESTKRADYDRFGDRTVAPAVGSANLWETFFGGSVDRGRNVKIRLEVDLKDALYGTKRNITITQKGRCKRCDGRGFTDWVDCGVCKGSGQTVVSQPPLNIYIGCPNCHGTGRTGTTACADCVSTGFSPLQDHPVTVDVPAGVETGMQVRLAGMGEPGRNGASYGDLFVILMVKDHQLYRRHGADLHMELPVGYSQLVAGAEATVPALSGAKVTFTIPPGTPTGTHFRIKEYGLPTLHNSAPGALVVTVQADVPKDLPECYKELLSKLQEAEFAHPGQRILEYRKRVVV